MPSVSNCLAAPLLCLTVIFSSYLLRLILNRESRFNDICGTLVKLVFFYLKLKDEK
jgi:hypothetical protein